MDMTVLAKSYAPLSYPPPPCFRIQKLSSLASWLRAPLWHTPPNYDVCT